MTTEQISGWGSGWGSTFWGDNSSPELRLLDVQAVAENVVRLVFNNPVAFTGLLDIEDGSRAARYLVIADQTTTGLDGQAAREVIVCTALQALDADPAGRIVDVTVDRSFSPFPAIYNVVVNGLVNAETGDGVDPDYTTASMLGCSRYVQPADPAKVNLSRDFANPQTLGMLVDSTGETDPALLGTHPIDSTGDYATDEGIQNLKKRVFRRLLTSKGAFAHAPGYGVGVPDQVKRLNIASVVQGIVVDAENQIGQEPDVQKVKVEVVDGAPGTIIFFIYIRTVQGLAVKFEAPFMTS